MTDGLNEIDYENFMGFDCHCQFLTDKQCDLQFDLLKSDDIYIYIYI